jgi:hypothetical protein
MVSMNVLAAQVNLPGQGYVGEVKRPGLDLISRRRVQFAALQTCLDGLLLKYLFLVDRWAEHLLHKVRLFVHLGGQHHREDDIPPLWISDRIGASKTDSRFLQDFPPVPFAFRGCFELRRETALRALSNHHFRVSDRLGGVGFARAQNGESRPRSDGDEDIRADTSSHDQLCQCARSLSAAMHLQMRVAAAAVLIGPSIMDPMEPA